MKASEIRGLVPQQIEQEIEAAYRELLNLRFQVATRQLANHRQIRKVRKEVTRLKTIQKEKDLTV